jgi:hypothetical protein
MSLNVIRGDRVNSHRCHNFRRFIFSASKSSLPGPRFSKNLKKIFVILEKKLKINYMTAKEHYVSTTQSRGEWNFVRKLWHMCVFQVLRRFDPETDRPKVAINFGKLEGTNRKFAEQVLRNFAIWASWFGVIRIESLAEQGTQQSKH